MRGAERPRWASRPWLRPAPQEAEGPPAHKPGRAARGRPAGAASRSRCWASAHSQWGADTIFCAQGDEAWRVFLSPWSGLSPPSAWLP